MEKIILSHFTNLFPFRIFFSLIAEHVSEDFFKIVEERIYFFDKLIFTGYGILINGEKNGLWIDELMVSFFYQNGLKQGFGISRSYEKIKLLANYENEKLEGVVAVFVSGDLFELGFYKNNKEIGYRFTFSENGLISKIINKSR